MTSQNDKKLVAIINKRIDIGVAMNALAHATLGFQAATGKKALRLDTYVDKDDNTYPNISQMPFIILKGKSGEIRKIVHAARDDGILHGTFVNTMTGGTYSEQLENTKSSSEEDLQYYATVLYGDHDKVTGLTKKLSLFC